MMANGKTSAQWEEQWRGEVVKRLEEMDAHQEAQAKTNQESALILRDVAATMKDFGARIEKLEQTPTAFRMNLGTYGGCIGQVVFALFGSIGALGGIAGVISVLWTIFHH